MNIRKTMNNRNLSGPALLLVIATGCATNDTQFKTAAETNLREQTGAAVPWIQTASDAAREKQMVEALLKEELTLNAAIQIAVLNNRGLQAEIEEIGISKAELTQVGLFRNPEFSASVRFPNQPPSAANTEFSVATDLLDLIYRPVRKRFARQALEQTQLRLATEVLNLAHEVEVVFYSIQAQEQLQKRLKIISGVNEAAADLAQRQHAAGNTSDLDLANAQVIFSQSRILAVRDERELRKSQQHLNRLLGLWGKQTAWRLSDQLPELPKEEIKFDALESLAVTQRKDLAALEGRANSIGAALELKRRTRYSPAGVKVGVDTERDPDRTRLTGPNLSLELPIFDQGQGAIARLAAEHRQAQRAFEDLAIRIRSEVNEAVDTMIANRALTEYLGKTVLPQQIKIANETLLQYNAMQKPTYELLTAKERELNAERDYIETLRDYWIARADLQKAIGGKIVGTETGAAAPISAATPMASQPHQH
ncbi:MAG: czcC 1 [Verrucomicrobiales bacterium]|jgi:cobalt-zinc-cadmium efflux system outer membrane protein|nr:czcC 1 [Verrucomicrobiales bacterium]